MLRLSSQESFPHNKSSGPDSSVRAAIHYIYIEKNSRTAKAAAAKPTRSAHRAAGTA